MIFQIQLFQSNSMMFQSAPAWSMKAKAKPHKPRPTPPPDAYTPNTNPVLSKSPAWKLGKQLRNQSSSKKVPAPNRYNPSPSRKSTKFGIFGHEQRIKQLISSTPGPGSYHPPANKQNMSSSFTHQPKCVLNINDFPGPGAYEPTLAKGRRGVKMTRQKRFTTQGAGNLSPGPGNYHYERSNSASMSFGKAERVTSPINRDSLAGPGQYQFTTDFEENAQSRKGFTLGARHTTKAEPGSPGPANYSPTHGDLPASPSITMSMKFKERKSNRTPSPHQYDPQFKATILQSESFSIGKAEKLSLKVDSAMPGPGAYLKAEYLSTGISVSLGKSRKHEEGEDFPGPGAYDPHMERVQRRPASAKIGKSMRFQKMKTEMSPSPGFYESKVRFDNPMFSFPKKKRLEHRSEQQPGPGTYNIPSTLCNVPSYALK